MTTLSTQNTNTSTHTANTDKEPRSYYDAHTTFEGYINRAELVTPTKSRTAKPYWSVSLCMLSGSKDKPTKTTVDTIVRGAEAEQLIAAHTKGIGKVAIYGRFKVSDIASKSYTSKKTGQLVHALTGRLILIAYLKVADDVVHCSPELKDHVPHAQYDVQTTFPGFVNSAKLEMSEQGKPYWRVGICMLSGSTDAPTKTIVNTVVQRGELEEIIEKHTADLVGNTKETPKEDRVVIFGSFKLHNISPSSYINKKEVTAHILQGRLTAINYLKVGKDVVIQAPQQGYIPNADQHASQATDVRVEDLTDIKLSEVETKAEPAHAVSKSVPTKQAYSDPVVLSASSFTHNIAQTKVNWVPF